MPDRRYTLVARGGRVELVHDDVPAPAATEALLRVRYSLVSPGTERHYLRAQAPDDALPLGYCAVGSIAACGDEVRHVAPGDLAIAMGWTLATHASHVAMPTRLVAKVPAGVEPRHAVLATLGATAVHAADRARLTAGDRVLVVGLGPVGMLQAMVAAARGCEVWAWDRDPAALAPCAFWRPLDPLDPPPAARGAITAAFVCIDGDATPLFGPLVALLAPAGGPERRSRIVNVGRLRGAIQLDPAAGNIDIINASRCGAGYRDDAYHHGRAGAAVVDGEHTVDANLERALAIVAGMAAEIDRLPRRIHTVAEALAHYHDGARFSAGFHLIDHGAP